MATAAQIHQELQSWNKEEEGYTLTAYAVSDTLWGDKTISIPSGTVRLVENFGGEGQGDLRYIVIGIGDQLFQYDGYYSSWSGTEWEDDLYEVEAYEVTVTKYRPKKD